MAKHKGTVVITGRGGTGKSTFTSMMAKYMGEKNIEPVLLVAVQQDTVHNDFPFIGVLNPVQTAQQRRFSGPRRTDDANHRAPLNFQGYLFERLDSAREGFADVSHTDNRVTVHTAGLVGFSRVLANPESAAVMTR